MRIAGILFRGCIVTAILGSCSSSNPRSAVYTVESDQDTIARLTGTWSRGEVTIEICDDRSKAFCATDQCKASPCHDVTREGKAETLTYEASGGTGCDGCYGCECFDVRVGVAITARAIADGRMRSYTGTAVARGRDSDPRDQGWLLEVYDSPVVPTSSRTPLPPLQWEIVRDGDGGGDVLLLPGLDGGGSLYPDRFVKTESGATCP